MAPDVMMELMQFGVAGVIAWMWMMERRASQGRERELSEAHERLMEQRVQIDALMALVRENTRAIAALEGAQRGLSTLVEVLAERLPVVGGRAA
ncbi:MAG: hypothetical protein AAFX05_10470 [Planctomycetota bacterium]